MCVTWGTAHYGQKVFTLHQSWYAANIRQLRTVKTDSGHNQHDYVLWLVLGFLLWFFFGFRRLINRFDFIWLSILLISLMINFLLLRIFLILNLVLFHDIFQKHRPIIANDNFISLSIITFQQLLDQEPNLTWRIPLEIFHLRKHDFGQFGHFLYAKRRLWVVMEHLNDLLFGQLSLFLAQEVGNEHLAGSEHAAPPCIWSVVSGLVDRFDAWSISH